MAKTYRIFLKLSVAMLSVFLLAAMAGAADFDGTSSGIFQNPVGPSGMVTTGVGTSFFTWGAGQPTPSSLQFTGGAFSGFFEQEFSLGTLTYYNGVITGNTGADSVQLLVSLAFANPPGNQSFTFPLNLINTPNVGSPEDAADYVQLGSAFDPTKFFTVGDVNYYLQFTRFGNVGPGGFITTVTQFHVLEEATANADVFGKLTANPVPLPGAVVLLGSGLVGLVGLRRKFKN